MRSTSLLRLGSLRTRLFVSLVTVIALAAVILGGVAYRSALAEANGLFDYNMRQMALSLRSGNPLASLPAGIEQEPGWQGIDFAVQVLTLDGVGVFASSRDLVLPTRPEPGFSNVVTPRGHFRIFALRTASRQIQVAQDLAVRQQLARSFAWRTIGPVALLLPLLLLVVWWVVTRSLAPVARVRAELAARAADALEPVVTTALPDEIRPVVEELNALLARLQTAFRTQQQFVADAAHELRSPLAALRLQLQRVRVAGSEAERGQAIGPLEDGITRAAALIEQLLTLARETEAGRVGRDAGSGAGSGGRAMAGPGRFVPFGSLDLAALAREAVIEAAPAAEQRGIDLGLAHDSASSPQWVAGEADSLAMLMRNLLGNAIKYTPPGGFVDVAVRVDTADTIRLVVDDSGPGISPEDRERVFDRFHRGAGQSAAVPGSGLGLAIVRAIADRHRATIRLGTSAQRGGLRVEVDFPRVSPPDLPSDAPR